MQLSINIEENISKMFKQFVEDCKNIKLAKTTSKTFNQVWAAIFVTLKVSTQLQIFCNLPLKEVL